VTYRNVSREVVARPATPEETEEIFARSVQFYPGYAHYRRRVGDSRRIRVFVLETA
jgi:hypothetical protein